MNTLASSRGEAALLEGFPGSGRAPQASIRELLRDTALVVATLSASGLSEDVAMLRKRCRQLIEQFAAALEQHGHDREVRDDALVAQCALLDETALRHLSAENRSQWDSQPLQVERSGRHDAGERVFERLEQRMREPSPNVELLECYAAILGLGFEGRYAREGGVKRAALISTLSARLETLRPATPRAFVTDRAGTRLDDWFYRLSPWAIAAVACVAAVAIWLIGSAVLDGQLAQLGPKAIRP
jgi:type VI secretion system protein ImpK